MISFIPSQKKKKNTLRNRQWVIKWLTLWRMIILWETVKNDMSSHPKLCASTVTIAFVVSMSFVPIPLGARGLNALRNCVWWILLLNWYKLAIWFSHYKLCSHPTEKWESYQFLFWISLNFYFFFSYITHVCRLKPICFHSIALLIAFLDAIFFPFSPYSLMFCSMVSPIYSTCRESKQQQFMSSCGWGWYSKSYTKDVMDFYIPDLQFPKSRYIKPWISIW